MNKIFYLLFLPVGRIVRLFLAVTGDVGASLLLLAVTSTALLLPIDLRCRGSFSMGEKEAVTRNERQMSVFSFISAVLRIYFLLGAAYVINRPIEGLLSVSPDVMGEIAGYINANTKDISYQYAVIDAVKQGSLNMTAVIGGVDAKTVEKVIQGAFDIDTSFAGFELGNVCVISGGRYVVLPVISALSSGLECAARGRRDRIRKDIGELNGYAMMWIVVGISLYIGLFTTAGTVIYWTAVNLLSALKNITLRRSPTFKTTVKEASVLKDHPEKSAFE